MVSPFWHKSLIIASLGLFWEARLASFTLEQNCICYTPLTASGTIVAACTGMYGREATYQGVPGRAYREVYTYQGVPRGVGRVYTHQGVPQGVNEDYYTHQGASLGVRERLLYPPGCLSGWKRDRYTHQGASLGVNVRYTHQGASLGENVGYTHQGASLGGISLLGVYLWVVYPS